MSEDNGHFEKGRWVEGSPEEEMGTEAQTAVPGALVVVPSQENPGQEGSGPAADEPDPAVIEQKISEASASVAKAINDVIGLAHGVITTDDGHRYVEKTVKDAGSILQNGINEVFGRVQETLKRKEQDKKKPE